MATRSYPANVDLQQNELQNAVVQNLSTAPSNPKVGQEYYNTTTNQKLIWNGTAWIDETSQGDYTFQNGVEQVTNTRNVQIKLATGGNAGNVTLTADGNGLAASAPSASTSTAGLIEIATDSEVSTGTSETLAVNPKQLATKVDKLTSGPTAGTYSRVTVNAEGQVTAGGDISVASGSSNYMTFTSSNGELSLNVDTTVTDASTNLVTSGAVSSAIASALVGALNYQGTWTATSQTDYSSIALPVKKGYMYLVEGSATIGGVEWNAGDYLIINKDIAAGGTITSSDVDKIDNTEGADIVRLNATQTLTNKTLDADDNTIQNLETDNFKSGVIVASVGATGSDTAIPTEKAVRTAISALKVVATNPALTASGGQVTWTVTAANSPNCICTVRETTSGEEVYPEVTYGSGSVTIKMNSGDVAADTYTAVVVG